MLQKNKINKYTVIEKIAEGGMGAIFKAKHPTLKIDVILKKLTLKNNSSIIERFKREAQLMLDFSHDNIVKVYDHFKEGSSYYIVMEYIDGISLEKFIKNNRYIDWEIALIIFNEICKALKYAHDKGVIHRDIKPDNVLISKDGAVKLTDFGIARSIGESEDGLTSAGMTLGTPLYMSPEQIENSKDVDKRADIYSLGVLLYVMITGKGPFPGNFTPEAINKIQKGKYIKPGKIIPGLPSLIKTIIRKSMHHKKNKRYKDLSPIIIKLSKKLKKYKTKSIPEVIKNFVFLNKKNNLKKKTKSFKCFFIKFLIGIFLLSSILAFLVIKNYHYEYIYSSKFSKLKLQFKISKNYKDPGEIFYKVSLYEKKSKGYKKINLGRVKVNNIIENSKFYLIELDNLYLKTRYYRIKVDLENQSFERYLFLYPREMQRKEVSTENGKVITITHDSHNNLPVKLNYMISSGGDNITAISKLQIKNAGRWKLWQDFNSQNNFNKVFLSGYKYYFKVSADNHYTKYFNINIEPYTYNYNLNIELIKKPASLQIKKDNNDYVILLNSKSCFLSGYSKKKLEHLIFKNNKSKNLLLDPGSYILTIKHNEIEKKVSIDLDYHRKNYIYISYNSKTNSIEIKNQK